MRVLPLKSAWGACGLFLKHSLIGKFILLFVAKIFARLNPEKDRRLSYGIQECHRDEDDLFFALIRNAIINLFLMFFILPILSYNL